ncbi:MAG TPA: hypothetical protein PKZ27_03200 [Rhodocyclaceae bacterium]|nr:hypothetical protein [Rhodocyclaceae bacterium]
MKPTFKNFSIYQGQTFRDQLLLIDAAGDPVDLSAMTARMQVRADIESPDAIVELTTDNGGIALAADGLLTFNISAADTAALGAGQYDTQQWVYDLELVTPAATPIVDRLLTGTVAFYPEITR